MNEMFYSFEKSSSKKIQYFPLSNFRLMLQHRIIQFSLHYQSSGRLREVKNQKLGHGRLREVFAYKRFQLWWFDWKLFGILENWSLRRDGRNRRSTVLNLSLIVRPRGHKQKKWKDRIIQNPLFMSSKPHCQNGLFDEFSVNWRP